MAVGWAGSVLLSACFLYLQKSAFSGYEAINPPNSTISYNQNNSSVRTFPDEINIPRERYEYFFNDLNFNISSRLLTGAADKLYLFDLDLNVLSSYEWRNDSAVASCNRTNDNSTYTCRNHIRTFKQLPSNNSQILVCGTQADAAPRCRIVELSGDVFRRGLTTGPASNGLLSYYPEYTSFGEFLEANSSDERFFSAGLGSTDRDFRISFSDVTLSDPANPDTLQTSELFRTLANMDRWLDFPVTFVDYFRADYRPVSSPFLPEQYQFYFVFLRESLTNADVIYSRVARICRNDPGLTSSFGSQFTTFMKARIFCEREVPPGRQFAGTVDFQYNEIKSMVFNDEGRYGQTTDWVKLMYGAFTGPSIGPVGTAICVYRAYNGVEMGESGFNRGIFDIFREDLQDAQGGEVESSFVECRPEGRSEANSELIQVVQDVSQIGENPLLVLDGLIVTQMAVDQVCVVQNGGMSCVNQDILFLGTDTGKIMKVIFVGSTADTIPIIAEEITLDDDNAVNQLNIQLADDSSKYIYASTFSKIYRLPLDRCDRHNNPSNVTESCRSCISSRDPYCVWNNSSRSCQSNPLVVQTSSTNSDTSIYLQNVHTDEIPSECTFPEIGFTMSSGNVSESVDNYVVTIRSSVAGEASSRLVEIFSVPGEPREGYATAGKDYNVSGEAITFPPDSTETTYTITLSPDNKFEGGDELLIVGLRATGAGGVVISQGQFTLTIIEDDTVNLSLDSAEITINEGANLVNINITKDGMTTVDTRVILSTLQNGTAMAGEDYFPVETEVTFFPSESIKTVTIPLVNDNVQESREWFLVKLVLPADQGGALNLRSPVESNITIEDDDSVVIQFSKEAATVNESEGMVTLTLVKNGQTMMDYELEITLIPGSAGTSDYIAPTPSVTFPASVDQITVTITIVDDNILEDQESLSAQLRVANGFQQEGVIADSNITITIIDNDSATVGFNSTNYATSEGDVSVTIGVLLSTETETEVAVELITIAGTATAGDDFSPESTRVTFLPGGSTSLRMMIQILDNTVLEATEYFTVELISCYSRVSVQQRRVNISIEDDDTVTVGLAAAEYTASEMNGTVAVEIRLLGSTDIPLTFFLFTAEGTDPETAATSGEDFESISMLPVVFSSSLSAVIVNVPLINDDTVEHNEQFEIMLERAESLDRVNVDRNTTIITIQDNDFAEFGFETANYPTSESVGIVEVAVVKYGSSSLPLSVGLSTMSDSATSPLDFTPINGQDAELTFSPAQNRQTVNISIINDDIFEDSEEFTVLLMPNSFQSRVCSNITTVQISDDDTLTVEFSPTLYYISEGGGAVLLDVSVNRQIEAESVVLQASLVDGTATNGADFNYLIPSTLEFCSGGDNSTQVTVTVVDDNTVEMNEEFSVEISSTNPRVIVQGSMASVTVIDDDVVEFGFEAVSYHVSESVGIVEVGVVKYGSSSFPLSVNLSTMSGSATSNDDFIPIMINGIVLTFSPTESRQTVNINIIDDDVLEDVEQFLVMLTQINSQAPVMNLLNSANITISDDDRVSVNLTQTEYMISEGAGMVSIGVVFGEVQSRVAIGLSTIPGTASGDTDFVRVSQLIMLTASSSSPQTVTIQLVDDNILEDREYFTVQLFSTDPGRVALQQSIATLWIMDDDSVSVGFGSPTYTASETDCFTSVNIALLSGSTDIPLNFNLTTTTNRVAAQAGQDFVSVLRMPITIYPGSAAAAEANIQLLDDNLVEKDPESFMVLLEPGEGLPQGVTIDNNTTNVYIEDDDFFTTQVAETSAAPTTVPTTTFAGSVSKPTSIIPGIIGSLEDRCIYDSFTTSAAVLAVLLAIIVLLLLLLLICCCVLVRERRRTIPKKYLPDELQVSTRSKETSPDRFPMENFGIPNKVYRENSSSSQSNNTPALKRLEDDFGDKKPPKVILNSNNNGNTEGKWQPGFSEDLSQSSSEDLTMTKL